jgi:hypothetical protein
MMSLGHCTLCRASGVREAAVRLVRPGEAARVTHPAYIITAQKQSARTLCLGQVHTVFSYS